MISKSWCLKYLNANETKHFFRISHSWVNSCMSPHLYHILMGNQLNTFNSYQPQGKIIWHSCRVNNWKVDCLVSQGIFPRLYILCKVEFIAWRLKHPNRRILMGSSIFWYSHARVSIRAWFLTTKWPCVMYWLGRQYLLSRAKFIALHLRCPKKKECQGDFLWQPYMSFNSWSLTINSLFQWLQLIKM